MKWERVTVNSVAKVVTKGTTPTSIGFDFAQQGIPFLRVNNIQGKKLQYDDILFIDQETDKALARSRIQPQDVLLSIAGTIGRSAVVPPDAPQMNCNQAVAIIRLNEKIDPYYFQYWLDTNDAIRQITGSKVTATISNLSLGCIKELLVPLPPITEQRRIAAILDRADAVRRKRQEAIRLTEELLRSAFLEMFGDPVTNPKGWKVVSMKEVVSQTQYGTAEKANSDGIGIPILRMNNITYTGEINLDDIKWCSITPKDESKFTVQRGDLLFNRTNSPELVGKTAVWRSEERYAYAGYLVRVRFNENQALSEYVSAYLNSSYGKKYLFEKAKPSNNMSNFSASEFLKIPLLLPPFDLQKHFVFLANAARSSIYRLEEGIEDAEKLFNSLLQRAFRGEL